MEGVSEREGRWKTMSHPRWMCVCVDALRDALPTLLEPWVPRPRQAGGEVAQQSSCL